MKLILKLNRLLFTLGAMVLVWIAAVVGRAAEPAPLTGEDVLLEVLPEKSLPDLQAALERAMGQSSRVIASLLDLDQARVGEKQARAPMLPYASLSGSLGVAQNKYDYDSYPIKDANGVTVVDANGNPKMEPARSSSALVQDLSYNAGLNQPIYYWGALKKGYQSAQLQKAIASRNVEEIRRTLAIEIRRAYFSLISTVNGLDSEKATLAKMEEERDYLKKQAEGGFVTQSIADSADVRIKDYKLQMERSRNGFDAQWLSFCELTGLDRKSQPLVFPKEIPAVSKDLNPVLPGLASHSGQYIPANLANADDSIRVERLNYEIASTRLRPRFGLGLNASRGYHTPDTVVVFGGPYVVTNFGVSTTVNWAIFDGFSTQAAKQSSLIRLRQQQRARDQAQNDYEETLKNNVTNLRMNWQTLQRSEEALTGARDSVAIIQKDFETGMVEKQKWDAAKTIADNSLMAANNARADYYLQIITYLSLRGKDPAVNLVVRTQSLDAPKK
ncbi:MAG: TolC family protein [Verrucomicrobia bacterium]|nr:TolC family protein [Verrucomicrobiota bacterium]